MFWALLINGGVSPVNFNIDGSFLVNFGNGSYGEILGGENDR